MKKIYLSFLIIYSAYANAVLLPVGNPAENGRQTYWSTDDKKFVHKWDMVERDKYISRSAASGHIEAGGKKSANSVSGTVKQSVSKKTVFANLFKNAKLGGKLVGKVFGVASWVYLGYELVNPWLVKGGWLYDPDSGSWKKAVPEDKTIVFKSNDLNSLPARKFDDKSFGELCQQNTDLAINPSLPHTSIKNVRRTCQILGIVDNSAVQTLVESACAGKYTGFKQCVNKDANGNSIWEGFAVRTLPYAHIAEMTQEDFDKLIEPVADYDPYEFVDKSRPSPDVEVPGIKNEEVKIPRGTVAQTSPYTNEQGDAEQTRWDFGEDSQGQTTVKESRIPRPDIQPDSPGAPRPNPNPKPDGNPNPNQNDKPEEKPQEGFLCSLFPDILACQKMGEPDESIFDDIQIPQAVNDTTFQPDNFLPLNGVCPQPKSFHVVGREYSIDYSPLCSFMENVRFMILLAFSVAAAYISFSGLRSDK